jgi:hypothetical protein
MTSCIYPYNVQITPDGRLGLVNNNGGGGASDGQVDTVAVIDMTMDPPRVVDQVVVGDGPEGLAMSPAGGYAASIILNGVGNVPKTAFFHHDHSYVSLLKIDGKKVRKVSETELGGLTEGAAFSPDGKYLYVGNFLDISSIPTSPSCISRATSWCRSARSRCPAIPPRCAAIRLERLGLIARQARCPIGWNNAPPQRGDLFQSDRIPH